MISKQHCLLMFINVRAGIVSRQVSDWLGVSAWLAMTLKSRLSTNHNAWKNSDVMLISKCTKSLVSVWRVLERDMSGLIFVFLQGIHALEQQKNYPGFFSNKNCIFSSWINLPTYREHNMVNLPYSNWDVLLMSKWFFVCLDRSEVSFAKLGQFVSATALSIAVI